MNITRDANQQQHFDNSMKHFISTVGQYTTARTNAICYWLIEVCTISALALSVSQYDDKATGFKEYGMYAATLALFLISFAGAVFCIWTTMNAMNKKEEMKKSYRTTRNRWVKLTLNNHH